MRITLIKKLETFTLYLPTKIKGQYWVCDKDNDENERHLLSVEEEDGHWVAKSNLEVTLLDDEGNPQKKMRLTANSYINIIISGEEETSILYVEEVDASRKLTSKYLVQGECSFSIGRSSENNIIYDNPFVSRHHATLKYNGQNWSIESYNTINGVYVDGLRVMHCNLKMGDCINILGLKIIVGHDFFVINNPDGRVMIRANVQLMGIQTPLEREKASDIPKTDFFYPAPRFYREIEPINIDIDTPPSEEKMDSTPMALTIGSSVTMGIASMIMCISSVTSVVNTGGTMLQAFPSIAMASSMLLGCLLFPVLTRKYEDKKRFKKEKIRQQRYLEYLDKIRDEIKRVVKEQSEILRENFVSPEECVSRAFNRDSRLWERRFGQSDFLQFRLGIGDKPIIGEVRCDTEKFSVEKDHLISAMLSLGSEPKLLSQVPISVSLYTNSVFGVYGEHDLRNNLLKDLILQITTMYSYDEVKLMLISEESEDEWNFIRRLPHFWSANKDIRFYARSQDEMKVIASYIEKNISGREKIDEPYYIIFATSEKLVNKCEPLQKVLRKNENIGVSVVFAARELRNLPKETRLVVEAKGENSRIFDKKDTSGVFVSFKQDIINVNVMNRVAAVLANIYLDVESENYALPSMLTFLDMFEVSKVEHLNILSRWKENNPTISLQTPVGVDTYGGQFELDLHEKYHGPHGLVAGMTGSGKSEFIITYVLSLAVNYHPDEVAFVLIDYKGGGLTGAFLDEERGIKLPHLAGTITNLDGAAIKRSLISIQSELRRRQAIFNEARRIANEGTMDIYKYQQLYRDRIVTEPIPHLFIISDEFAELKTQQPDFMEQLISTARIGRSLGVHLILATQKPNGVVDDQIWSNSKFRVCLKVQDTADSQDMIKCPDAAELVQTGRFYLQVGFNELFALGQSAWCGAEYVPTDVLEKKNDLSVQVIDNIGRDIMSAKAVVKHDDNEKKIKQVVSIVNYLSSIAESEHISVRNLWLPAIPAFIKVDDVNAKYGCNQGGDDINPVIGEYDDPFNQEQHELTVPFTEEGNCLVIGSAGNGKTTFCTTLCYSLIKNYTAEQVNIYIMDFGAETLKIFEDAPQVGGVMVSTDEEKIENFIKLLNKQIELRKEMDSYPSIIVVINNYAIFTELYEDYIDPLAIIMRDGVKFGIYFAVTITGISDMRYRVQQNFKRIMALQLNDESDYASIVGKTEGLVPTKCKGRGLIAMERVYEYQVAYCHEEEDMQDFLLEFISEIRETATTFAKKIPVLPKRVDKHYLMPYAKDLSSVPVGVSKNRLEVVSLDIRSRVIYPFISQDIEEMKPLIEETAKVLDTMAEVEVIETEKNFEEKIQSIFMEMVTRNNTYKEADMDESALEVFQEKVFIIFEFSKLINTLSTDGMDKLSVMLEKAEAIYKLHFILVDTSSGNKDYSYEDWYKKQYNGAYGLWYGNGIKDQYNIQISSNDRSLYAELEMGYGYLIQKGRPVLTKLASSVDYELDY